MNNYILSAREEINNLIENIIYLRKKNNFSKKLMAEKLGVSTYSLNIIENGRIPDGVSVELLLNIEKEFGILPSQQFIKLEK